MKLTSTAFAANAEIPSAHTCQGGRLPPGGCDGVNDWKRPGYNGLFPPIGRHR